MNKLTESNREAATAASTIAVLVSAASGTEEGRAAAKNIGNAAVTISAALNNVLLPIAAVNYAFESARAYFKNSFHGDITPKLKKIPSDSLIEPDAQIAHKVLNGLSFSHQDSNLKEMYLTLLAGAMSSKTKDVAHPAFAEIISQLSSEEAKLLVHFIQPSAAFPVIELRVSIKPKGYKIAHRHLANFLADDGSGPEEIPKFPVYLANWIRLGLVNVDYSTSIVDQEAYSWVETRKEYQRALNTCSDSETLSIGKGVIEVTAFGEQFGSLVL